jgi:hypothetical protein
MFMRLTLALLSWLALVSCISHAETTAMTGADTVPPDSYCEQSASDRGPDVRVVNINYESDPIQVAPTPVCVRPGDVLKFQLNGHPDTEVSVEGKTISSAWISGAAKGKHKAFFVLVPFDLLPDSVVDATNFSYYMVTAKSEEETKILDPEVRVKRNYE